MPSLDKIPLSGSTHGRPIKIGSVATPGTLLHTAYSTTTDGKGDSLVIDVYNFHTSALAVAIEFGGVTSPDDNLVVTIPAKEKVRVIDGLLIRNGLEVRAIGGAANLLMAAGWVIRSS